MSVVPAPADRRFRRARVAPVRRVKARVQRGLRIARAVITLAALVYAGYRAVALVKGMALLRIDRVEVHGNQRLSEGEVLALVDGLEGRNILTVSLDDWRERLLGSAWVEDASLRRTLPGTVTIAIEERRPLAIGRIGNRLFLVDATGVVIDDYGPQHVDLDLPIVDGLAPPPPGRGTPAIDSRRAQLASRLVSALGQRPDLAARVSQIDVSDRRNAVVILEGDTALLRLGDRSFTERIQSYIELAPTLREQVAEIDYVDLRFDERLYVRPTAAAARQ